ncbi:MAG TPA: hypothetical protein VJV21_07625, partial [Pyrinomonadaceae bacterium]|nr:hypothetical protein [Pyrinomonadaceae bacterium]
PDRDLPAVSDGALDDVEEVQKSDRTNADFFGNAKAQAWWNLRMRFRRTFLAVTTGRKYNPDFLISISSTIPEKMRQRLCMELSQPTWVQNNVGKILIDKMPDGSKSPNLGDSVMIAYAPRQEEARGFFDM